MTVRREGRHFRQEVQVFAVMRYWRATPDARQLNQGDSAASMSDVRQHHRGKARNHHQGCQHLAAVALHAV